MADTCATPYTDSKLPLTLERLSVLPRRNNGRFISSYVEEQRLYCKHYAAEGHREILAWDGSGQLSAVETLAVPDDFTIGTPILKPRVPVSTTVQAAQIEKPWSSSKDAVPLKKAALQTNPKTSKQKTALPINRQDSLTRTTHKNIAQVLIPKEQKIKDKQAVNEIRSSDHEYTERLEERRERKRLKRSIMKSEFSNIPDKENNDPNNSSKKRKSSCKARTNLALMHGFSATNVGKNRITLQPVLRTAGVFRKGRASCQSKIGKNAKKFCDNIYFSEAHFLKGDVPKKSKKGVLAPSISSTGSSINKDVTSSSKRKISHYSKSHEGSNPNSEHSRVSKLTEASSLEKRKAMASYDPDQSIVWDIERSNGVLASEDDSGQGMIEVNFLHQGEDKDHHPQRKPNIEDNRVSEETDLLVALSNWDQSQASDISLAPSQSASRVMKVGTRKSFLPSKYFPQITKCRTSCGANINIPENTQLPVSGPQLIPSLVSANSTSALGYSGLTHVYENTFDALATSCCVNDTSSPESPQLGWISHLRSLADDMREMGCEPELGSCSEDWNPIGSNLLSSLGASVIDPGAYQHEMADWIAASQPEMDILPWDLEFDPETQVMEVMEDISSPFYSHGPGVFTAAQSETECDCSMEIHLTNFSLSPVPRHVESIDECELQREDLRDDAEELWDPPDSGSTGNFERFLQGRTLLYGLNSLITESGMRGILDVEAEVAGLIRQNHWLPQRL